MGHARALLTLAPPAAIALARQAAEHGWSVREVEHRVQQLAAGKVAATRQGQGAKAKPQADIATLERELSESLGTRSTSCTAARGRGRLVIHYSDLESLDGVLDRLRGRRPEHRPRTLTAAHDRSGTMPAAVASCDGANVPQEPCA